MKQKSQKLIINNIDQIIADIKTKVLDKHGLDDVHVHEISFSGRDGCPDGQHRVCQSFGIDPITKKPIIVCNCVPDDNG